MPGGAFWILEALFTTLANTALTHLLDDLGGCQFLAGPGQERTLPWVQTEMQAGSAYSICTVPRAQDTFIGVHKIF